MDGEEGYFDRINLMPRGWGTKDKSFDCGLTVRCMAIRGMTRIHEGGRDVGLLVWGCDIYETDMLT